MYLCLFGLMFALGYLLTGELALPIGLHWSWNLFQGNVFGFPVSGKAGDGGGILRITQTGPDLLTGGSFGPEAGVVGLVALAAGCLIIVLYCRQTQGRLQLRGISYVSAAPEPMYGRARSADQRTRE